MMNRKLISALLAVIPLSPSVLGQDQAAAAASATSTTSGASPLKVAVYWGQGANQEPLLDICSKDTLKTIDIINIGFVNVFPEQGVQGFPGSDFGNACGAEKVLAPDGVTPTQLSNNCVQIAEGIKKCQELGKQVMLSLGGAIPDNYGITTDQKAYEFAEFLWQAFGPVKPDVPSSRPFGDAVVDGFDFDIEHGLSIGYKAMADRFKQLYDLEAGRKYYISAAPQCKIPDERLAEMISSAYLDYIYIQLYNTPECSARTYIDATANRPTTFEEYAKAPYVNKDVKIFAGLLGAPQTPGDTYYLNPDEVQRLVKDYYTISPTMFGGIMIWEASSAIANVVSDGTNFIMKAKEILNGLTPGQAPGSTTNDSTTPLANMPLPACPDANNMVYNASDGSSYQVQCNTNYPDDNLVSRSRQDTLERCIEACSAFTTSGGQPVCRGCSFRPTVEGENCFLKGTPTPGTGVPTPDFESVSAVLLAPGQFVQPYVIPAGGPVSSSSTTTTSTSTDTTSSTSTDTTSSTSTETTSSTSTDTTSSTFTEITSSTSTDITSSTSTETTSSTSTDTTSSNSMSETSTSATDAAGVAGAVGGVPSSTSSSTSTSTSDSTSATSTSTESAFYSNTTSTVSSLSSSTSTSSYSSTSLVASTSAFAQGVADGIGANGANGQSGASGSNAGENGGNGSPGESVCQDCPSVSANANANVNGPYPLDNSTCEYAALSGSGVVSGSPTKPCERGSSTTPPAPTTTPCENGSDQPPKPITTSTTTVWVEKCPGGYTTKTSTIYVVVTPAPQPSPGLPGVIVQQVPPVVQQAPPVVQQAPPVVQQAPPVVQQAPPVVQQAPPVQQQAPPAQQQPPAQQGYAPPGSPQGPGDSPDVPELTISRTRTRTITATVHGGPAASNTFFQPPAMPDVPVPETAELPPVCPGSPGCETSPGGYQPPSTIPGMEGGQPPLPEFETELTPPTPMVPDEGSLPPLPELPTTDEGLICPGAPGCPTYPSNSSYPGGNNTFLPIESSPLGGAGSSEVPPAVSPDSGMASGEAVPPMESDGAAASLTTSVLAPWGMLAAVVGGLLLV